MMRTRFWYGLAAVALVLVGALLSSLLTGGYGVAAAARRGGDVGADSREPFPGRCDLSFEIEEDTLAIKFRGHERVRGFMVFTHLARDPLMISERFDVPDNVSVTSRMPLSFKRPKGDVSNPCWTETNYFRVEFYEELDDRNRLVFAGAYVIVRSRDADATADGGDAWQIAWAPVSDRDR